jgi:hypothetical protein
MVHLTILAVSTVLISDTAQASNSSSISPESQTNTVSWETAFWTLVPFALNAMTQNSFLDRDFPSGILFPLRSSPLVCAADELEVILRLFWYMIYSRMSASSAASRIVWGRTWQPPQGNMMNMTASNAQRTLGNQYPLTHADFPRLSSCLVCMVSQGHKPAAPYTYPHS